MLRSGRINLLSFVTLAFCACASLVPEVSLSADQKSLSVKLVHGNKTCQYDLKGTSTFATDAKIIMHTETGAEQQGLPASRTFVSREPGTWATAILDDIGKPHMQVSGLFVCEDVLIDIPAEDPTLKPQLNLSNTVHSPVSAHPRRMRGGRHLAGTVVSEGVYEVANETEDWKLPAELGAYVAASSYAWQGEKWFPGCYSNDNELHVFKVGLVVDVAAVHKHGSRLNGLIESTVAKASFIYESQFNMKLEVSDLQIYTSATTAPDYATDKCPDIYTQLDQLTAGTNLPGGAVHLLTGCGQGFGIVGLAYVGSMCASRSNTGVSQLHNSMSWITFAHELGHNFGGGHSFEEGEGRTGGIMDYGDGRLNGEYQFNTKYRKGEMCTSMNDRKRLCGSNFMQAPPQPPPTPSPTRPPAPPSGGSCYGLEACRAAAQRLNLKTNGFAFFSFQGNYAETGCYTYTTWPWKGYAWYGLRDDGAEVQSDLELTVVEGDRYRLEGTYDCSATNSPIDHNLLSRSVSAGPCLLLAAVLIACQCIPRQLF